MWASALAAHTHDIYIFSTLPCADLSSNVGREAGFHRDNMSNGRFGINIVAGWNESEFGMFGLRQQEHDERYAVANEWLDAMEALWSDDAEYNLDGKFYTIKNGYLQPKPIQKPRPSSSPQGRRRLGWILLSRAR